MPEGEPVVPTGLPARSDAGRDAPQTFTAAPVPPPPAEPPDPEDPDDPPSDGGQGYRRDGGAPAPDARPAPLPPGQTPVPVPPPPPPPPVRMDAAAAPPLPPPPPRRPGEWWRPGVGLTWDWQLMSPIDASYDVDVYDIDLFDSPPELIADLRARGRKVICYVNLGAWEDWRPDAARFPREVIGLPYNGFPNEAWLDIRAITQLLPIIRSRLDLAVAKGCDAVEPDNVNGYDTMTHEPTGFPLGYMDQLIYNRLIAAEAHRRGLAVGLKNDLPQIEDLVDDFDFAVNEQCFEYDECEYLVPFIENGKPVFQTEYSLPLAAFCGRAREYRFSSIKKTDALNAVRELCP